MPCRASSLWRAARAAGSKSACCSRPFSLGVQLKEFHVSPMHNEVISHGASEVPSIAGLNLQLRDKRLHCMPHGAHALDVVGTYQNTY